MTPQLGDFAPELLHWVFRFCSKSDLASLSQVNNTFRQTAEYLLYRHIHMQFRAFTDPEPQEQARESLFYTLTSNPQKAVLIRSLHVQLEESHDVAMIPNHELLERIVNVLRNTHGLVDLRIMTYHPSDASKGKLSQVIRSGYFQLHTLYCDSFQDLEGIIVSQKHLRLLGIHNCYDHGYLNLSRLIKNRCNSRIDSNRSFPGIFMLTCSAVEPSYDLSEITLFPELCLPGQTFMLCRDIASSIDQYLGKGYNIVPEDYILEISVFDFSYEKTAIICEVVGAMAQFFVDCQAFSMWVQTSDGKKTISEPWRIPGVSASIRQFKQLQCLEFCVSSDDSLRQAAIDLRSLLLKEFVNTGLMLARVQCPDDDSMYAQLASDFGWEVAIFMEVNSDDSDDGEVYLDTSVID